MFTDPPSTPASSRVPNISKATCKFYSPLSQPHGAWAGNQDFTSLPTGQIHFYHYQVIKPTKIQTFLGHLTGPQEPDILKHSFSADLLLLRQTPFILLHVHSARLHSWIFREALQTAATLILISTSPPPSGSRTWSWTQPGMDECGFSFT